MAIELVEGGIPRLAVSVGGPTRGTALSRILSLRGSPGWIVGDTVREWHFEGVIEREGTVYFVGPRTAGVTLRELMGQDAGAALPMMARLVQALRTLSAGSAGWFPLQSDSVIFTGSGEIVVLPPALDRELRELRPFEDNRETFESLNHPDLKGEEGTVFSLCVVLYRILAGRFPFSGVDAEELHSQARSLEITAPAVVVPGLDAQISELVMAGLRRGRRGPVTVAQMATVLEHQQHRPLRRATGEEERRTAEAAAASRTAAAERSFRRRRFWEKNWRVAAIIAGAVIVLGALAGTILRNALAPRVTRGYTPARVVEAYYASTNTLDHQTMEACVVGSAGQGLVNETMTLYVTSRVTQGYEGRSSILSAADWDKAGRPPLVPPQSLFGVTGLSVSQEQGPPQPVYLVTYDLWNPAPQPDADLSSTAPPQSEGHANTDRVWLKQDHGDWVIYRIEQVTSTPLPPPVVGPPPAPRAGPRLGPAPAGP